MWPGEPDYDDKGQLVRTFPTSGTYDGPAALASNVYTRSTTRNAFNFSPMTSLPWNPNDYTFSSAPGPSGHSNGASFPRSAGSGIGNPSLPSEPVSASNHPAFRPGVAGAGTLLSAVNARRPRGMMYRSTAPRDSSRFDDIGGPLMRDMLRMGAASKKHFDEQSRVGRRLNNEAQDKARQQREQGHQRFLLWEREQAELIRITPLVEKHHQALDHLRSAIVLGAYNTKGDIRRRLELLGRLASGAENRRIRMLAELRAERVPRGKVLLLVQDYENLSKGVKSLLDCPQCAAAARSNTSDGTPQSEINSSRCPYHQTPAAAEAGDAGINGGQDAGANGVENAGTNGAIDAVTNGSRNAATNGARDAVTNGARDTGTNGAGDAVTNGSKSGPPGRAIARAGPSSGLLSRDEVIPSVPRGNEAHPGMFTAQVAFRGPQKPAGPFP